LGGWGRGQGEELLRGARDLPVVIARPSIVVGHRASGWTPALNVIYWPIRAFDQGAEAYLPYFDVRCSFDDSRAHEILQAAGVAAPEPGDFFERLIVYARETAWGKRPISRQAAMSAAGVP
jgi:hypothetical protein